VGSSRSLGSVGLGVLAALIAVVGGAAGLVAVTRTAAGDVPQDGRGLRRLGETGISVPIPDDWVDHRRAAPGVLLLEVEHRPVAGLFPTRGMWIGRWYPSGEAATELQRLKATPGVGWTDGPALAGQRSIVREEVIGPPAARRLPAAVTMHRRVLRLVAFDRVYEVGFWGPQQTLDDGVERAVLSRLSIEEPPPIELVLRGLSVTLPGSWNEGDCKGGVQCAFSPSRGDHPNDSWVYLFPWKAKSVDEGAGDLLASLGKQETRDLVHEPAQVAGQPAVRVRFAMSEGDTGPAEFEELVLPGKSGVVIVAFGWRTPEGRAQVDSVMQTLRL
jgi:hypothetical protein